MWKNHVLVPNILHQRKQDKKWQKCPLNLISGGLCLEFMSKISQKMFKNPGQNPDFRVKGVSTEKLSNKSTKMGEKV